MTTSARIAARLQEIGSALNWKEYGQDGDSDYAETHVLLLKAQLEGIALALQAEQLGETELAEKILTSLVRTKGVHRSTDPSS